MCATTLSNLATLSTFMRRFKRDESGATAIEYGLVLAIFSIVVTTALSSIGSSLSSVFTKVSDFLK